MPRAKINKPVEVSPVVVVPASNGSSTMLNIVLSATLVFVLLANSPMFDSDSDFWKRWGWGDKEQVDPQPGPDDKNTPKPDDKTGPKPVDPDTKPNPKPDDKSVNPAKEGDRLVIVSERQAISFDQEMIMRNIGETIIRHKLKDAPWLDEEEPAAAPFVAYASENKIDATKGAWFLARDKKIIKACPFPLEAKAIEDFLR